MKKIITAVLIILISVSACYTDQASNEQQTLRGKVSGDGRSLTADVIFRNGSIIDIRITDIVGTDENPEEAAQQVAYEIISRQSLSVDTVSGATATSQDVISAVEAALESGGISSDLFTDDRSVSENRVSDKRRYDVVIIGSGAAGLSAAIQAALLGDDVLVLEKMPIPGGSSFLSGAEIPIPENILSIDQAQDDSPRLMTEDILKASRYTANRELVSVICSNIADTVLWLQEYAGIAFNNGFYEVNGHSRARTTFADGGGKTMINKLVQTAEDLGVHILYNTRAVRLIRNEKGEITGVTAQQEEKNILFNAEQRVVIATGGFSANKTMREELNEDLKNLDGSILTTGPQSLTGDGITMGKEVGATTVNMEDIQIYPNTNPTTGILFFMDSRRIDMGAFYINKEGKRFVTENRSRAAVAKAVLEQTGYTMYEVFTQDIIDKILINDLARNEFSKWTHQGVLAKGDTIAECADFFSLDKKEVAKTLNRYNALIRSGKDDDFRREMNFPMLDEGPYYMLEGVPSIHYTLGGLKIDEKARVLDEKGKPIPRLYAAGEVTGGIFGKDRLGACAVPDALVFGRIAGGYEAK